MVFTNNVYSKYLGIFTVLCLQTTGLAFAGDSNESEVPVLALDGATSTSVATQVPIYEVGGAKAELEREEHSIEIEVHTSGLPLGAYTNWWVIFNEPSACAAAMCVYNDLFIPETESSVLWATNAILEDGVAEFEAELHEGELPGQVLSGSGLTNAQGAQIQYIIKWHGPASDDPDILYEQLYTAEDPNCETAPLPGLTGLGRCPDLQASAVFMP